MGQQGLCFRVVEVSGVSWCMGPLAELNKGAFFWLGLGASLTHLEVKPSASEGDSGGMGGSSRGQEKQWQWSCTGVQEQLPLGTSETRACDPHAHIPWQEDAGCPGLMPGHCPHPTMPS